MDIDKKVLVRAIHKIRKSGNSNVITLPPEVLNALKIKAGTEIMIKGKKKVIELSWFD